jgi:hypothetical protein
MMAESQQVWRKCFCQYTVHVSFRVDSLLQTYTQQTRDGYATVASSLASSHTAGSLWAVYLGLDQAPKGSSRWHVDNLSGRIRGHNGNRWAGRRNQANVRDDTKAASIATTFRYVLQDQAA